MNTTFVSKFNNKTYKNSKVTNYIRFFKKDHPSWTVEDFYNFEYDNPPHICSHCCEKETEFKNFTFGYKLLCKDCTTIKIATGENLYTEDYDEYVKENYVEKYLKIWNSKCCNDPYDNKLYSGTGNFGRYILRRKLHHKKEDEFWNKQYICTNCGDYYIKSIFKNNNLCDACIRKYGIGLNRIPTNDKVNKENKKLLCFSDIKKIVTCINKFIDEHDFKGFLNYIKNNKLYKNKSQIMRYLKNVEFRYLYQDICKSISLEHKFVYYKNVPIYLFLNKQRNRYIKTSCRRTSEIFNIKKECPICKSFFYTRENIFYDKIKEQLITDNGNTYCSHECYHKSLIGKEYSIEAKIKLSNIMKQKIKEGSFTPPVVNSMTRKAISLEKFIECKFRSSWELAFWYINKEQLEYNTTYEKLKIPYYDTIKGTFRTYIVDFIDKKNKKVYEIKPTTKIESQQNIDKIVSLEKWCKENNYSLEIITENYFIELIKNGFDFSFMKQYKKKIINLYKEK